MIRFAAFAFGAALLAQTTPAPPPPPENETPFVFKSDVALVRLDAQVVDRSNRAITGLRADDFVLREGGKVREIRNFVREEMPVDVLFLLDVSGSMQAHVRRIAEAARDALPALHQDDRAAILVFDRATRVRVPFRPARDTARDFDRVVNGEGFNGGTDITRGLYEAARYMSRHGRPEARRAIVMLTDDQTEFDRDDVGVLRELERANSIMTVLLVPDMTRRGILTPGPLPRRRGNIGLGWPGGMGWPGGGWPGGGRGYPGGGRYPGGGGYPGGGSRTRSAGSADIAEQSGGDAMQADDAAALQTTLDRIRQRYALYFQLPAGVREGDQRSVSLALNDAIARRYPDAELRYRRSYRATASSEGEDTNPVSAPSVSEAREPRPGTVPSRPAPGEDRASDPANAPNAPKRGGWRRVDQADPNSPGWRRPEAAPASPEDDPIPAVKKRRAISDPGSGRNPNLAAPADDPPPPPKKN